MARPLAKIEPKTGAPYTRPVSIEAKIDAALIQDSATLAKRVRLTDRNITEYLPTECLVHLIRDALRRGNHRVATLLMPPLLVRCEANLKRTVPDDAFRNAEAIRENILSSFQLLFTDDATEEALDYYECKFNRAFKSLRINHVRTEVTARKMLTELPEGTSEDGDSIPDADMLARLSRAARIEADQEDHVYLPQVLKAIDELPRSERQTFVLRRIVGLTEDAAAAACGVEGRTIRNRLKRADVRLKKLKEDL
jgi:Sigma-70, region 4